MSIRTRGALVASVAAFVFAPVAVAHGTNWRANAGHGQSFAEMQAASTEAPAFHAGDGSIYDSSRGLEASRRIATVPQHTSPSSRMTGESHATPPMNPAAQLDVDPATRIPSASIPPDQPGVATDRYGAPVK